MATASEICSAVQASVEKLLNLRPDCVSTEQSLDLIISEKVLGTEVLVNVPVAGCKEGDYSVTVNGVKGSYPSSEAIGEKVAKTFRALYTVNAMNL